MAFELAAVTAFIAALSITGKDPAGNNRAVTIKDWSGIDMRADVRQCPILQPDITQPIRLESVARDSFGDGAIAKQTLYYIVPYVLLYEPVGATRGLVDILPNVVATMKAIITAFIVNDTPGSVSVDLRIASFTLGGTVIDPSGNQFHGANIAVRIQEFIN